MLPVYCPGASGLAVRMCRNMQQAKELGYPPEYVFTTMSKNSKGQQLSDRYVQNMVIRYGKRAGIKKKISPHTMRHSFATDLYRLRRDPVVLKNALGHSNLSTTMVYIHLVGSDVEEALAGYPVHQGA